MTPASVPPSSAASAPHGENKTPRLPACPTTRGKPRPRVAPLASESDPHPVVQVVSARAYTHHSTHSSAEVEVRSDSSRQLSVSGSIHTESDR